MQYIFYLLALIALTGISGGLFAHFALFGAVPNLVLLFVLALAVKQDNLDFYFAAFVGGLLLDVSSGLAFGSYTVFFLIAGFITHQLFSSVIFYEFNWKHLPLLVAGSVTLLPLWLWLYSRTLLALHASVFPVPLKGMELELVWTIVYNLLLMYPIYWLATKLYDESKRLLQKSQGL